MVHDFTGVDRVYDELLRLGLRPIVELSFMPSQLARDPGQTVFSYEAVISPPRNWQHWADLVERFIEHLIDRYGVAEVRDHWAFEVWNEPNLEVFWSGTPAEYFHLDDVTVQAIRSVHPCLRVGGPGSAAGGWVEELLTHLDSSGAPLDFLSTHVYGNLPLDFRPALARHGREDVPIWWTEWGTTPTHFNPVGDIVFAAAFLLRGMRSALGRAEALSHWVASDHFEELGTPAQLFHGGFGLLSVGNLRKPRFWALAMLSRLGPAELEVGVSGDGAYGLVEALAARDGDGRIGVLVRNGSLDQHSRRGGPLLERDVQVRIDTAPGTSYTVSHYRIDETHSNIVSPGTSCAAPPTGRTTGNGSCTKRTTPSRSLARAAGIPAAPRSRSTSRCPCQAFPTWNSCRITRHRTRLLPSADGCPDRRPGRPPPGADGCLDRPPPGADGCLDRPPGRPPPGGAALRPRLW